MGLIAFVGFWVMTVKLWVTTGDARLPLAFAAIWGASMFTMGMLGVGRFFIAVEILLVIIIFFTEKTRSL